MIIGFVPQERAYLTAGALSFISAVFLTIGNSVYNVIFNRAEGSVNGLLTGPAGRTPIGLVVNNGGALVSLALLAKEGRKLMVIFAVTLVGCRCLHSGCCGALRLGRHAWEQVRTRAESQREVLDSGFCLYEELASVVPEQLQNLPVLHTTKSNVEGEKSARASLSSSRTPAPYSP